MLEAVIAHGDKKDGQITTSHHRRMSSHHFVKHFIEKETETYAIIEQAIGESPFNCIIWILLKKEMKMVKYNLK